MPIQVVSVEAEVQQIHSPFSGVVADGEELGSDDTLLFVHYGDAGEYGHLSERAKQAAAAAGLSDSEGLSPEEVLAAIDVPGAFALRIDTGWNGVNMYAFAPAQLS
jgi:hypothetical protein